MRNFVIALAIMALAASAGAQTVLWDQTAGYESWQQGFFNAAAGSPPFGSTMYTCNDVTVDGTGWIVDSITVYYDGFDWSWEGAISEARLFVEPKTGSLPTGDPSGGALVSASCAYVPGSNFMFFEITASGLALELAPGDYWIGLTPSTPTPDNIHVSVAAVGDDSPSYDPFGFPIPMWSNWVAGLDGAMKIQGDAAVAGDEATWGSVKSLFR
jgi:hypothetical protein